MTLKDFQDIMSTLNPVLLLLVSYFLNKKLSKQKKEINKDIEERDKTNEVKAKDRDEKRQKLVLDKLEDLEVNVTDMKMVLTEHVEDTDFRSEFKDILRNKSRQIMINLGEFLQQEHKSILSNWSDTIENFGLNFFYSSKRKKSQDKDSLEQKKELEEWLDQEIDIVINNFYNYCDFVSEEIKIYNKKKILFSEFLEQIKIHNRTELLKMRLFQNGLKVKDGSMVGVFSVYIKDFYSDFVKAVRIWYTLEKFNKEAA